ncbi:MAG: filamentous hemagglutinin N-terminal domain-containing protein, partial [Cyanobacteria bacterium P01_A01_bin.45]
KAHFNNTLNIQNIITRVTGKSVSNIDGILSANGKANLFLMNPNGIIFGENASLNIGGSFLATTASSINFADGTKFSAIQPQTTPLLTISVPIGLQFGSTAAPIHNYSQASPGGATNFLGEPVGLQVPTAQTLALVGGDIYLKGSNLTVDSGRIELGSVAADSYVSLNPVSTGWVLGYEGVENFQDIQISDRSVNGFRISSIVDVDNTLGGAGINIQGNLVEINGFNLIYMWSSSENIVETGDVNITAEKLVLRNGGQILNITLGDTPAGDLTVNASESIEIIGGFTTQNNSFIPSGLSTATGAVGQAGDLTIYTRRLLIKDGGVISASSSALQNQSTPFLAATGEAGNLIINASESVEIIGRSETFASSVLADTQGSAKAGNMTINTKRLVVKDEARISVSSSSITPDNLGDAGNLTINADFVILDNQGKITSETDSADGGNINLNLEKLLLMRNESQISTNAGKAESEGDGGNINIDVPDGFIIAQPNENSDITANAFAGSGGRVDINAKGLLGLQPRSRDELVELLFTDIPSELNPQSLTTSDITAISQQNPNLNGELNINGPNIDPRSELVSLVGAPLESEVSTICKPSRKNQSKFIFIQRSGLVPVPGEALRSTSPLDPGWVSLGGDRKVRGRNSIRDAKDQNQIGKNTGSNLINQNPNKVVEATGWIVDEKGNIVLTAF